MKKRNTEGPRFFDANLVREFVGLLLELRRQIVGKDVGDLEMAELINEAFLENPVEDIEEIEEWEEED